MDPQRIQEDEVIASLNVEFREGKIRRRPGRALLAHYDTVRPTKVLFYNGSTVSDVTDAITDGDLTTAAITSAFSGASHALYVGFPYRVVGINFTMSAFGSGGGDLAIEFFSRGSGAGEGAFVIAPVITDLTVVTSTSLAQNGKISFSPDACWFHATTPWHTGFPAGAAVPDGSTLLETDLYWIRFTLLAGTITGANIAEVSGSLVSSTGPTTDVRTAGIGLSEFVTLTGERLVVMQHDFPGPDLESFYMKPGETRFSVVDFGRKDLFPLRMPPQHKSARPLVYSGNANFNGWYIGATSEGRLFRFDGANCGALEAFQGLDAARGVLGARSYLAAPPRGRFLQTYRNKLMVAGDPDSPLLFYASLDDSDISTIPPDAPVGGPNVWPLTGVNTVPGREGDAITGTAVIGDRYVVLTRRQIWVWDEANLRQTEGDVGCVAPFSVQKVGDTLMFLSHHGVFVFDGAASREASAPIKPILEKWVKWSRIEDAVSGHDRGRQEYWLFLPTHGRDKNRLAVVYNYGDDSWRVVAGWYPWDDETRQDAESQQLNTSSVASIMGRDGKEILCTADKEGKIWQENTGEDDNGKVFPAFFLLKPIGNMEEVINWRTWRIACELDGSYIEAFALEDGQPFEPETWIRLQAAAQNSQYVQKRALGETRDTWEDPDLWSTDGDPYSKEDAVRFSFGGRARKLQVAIVLPGGNWGSAGGVLGWQEKVTQPGGIMEIRIDNNQDGQAR